jgi:hypothetical protein
VQLGGGSPTGPETVVFSEAAHRIHRAVHVSGARAVRWFLWCEQKKRKEILHPGGRIQKCGLLAHGLQSDPTVPFPSDEVFWDKARFNMVIFLCFSACFK